MASAVGKDPEDVRIPLSIGRVDSQGLLAWSNPSRRSRGIAEEPVCFLTSAGFSLNQSRGGLGQDNGEN